jgi:hypothetical protein
MPYVTTVGVITGRSSFIEMDEDEEEAEFEFN